MEWVEAGGGATLYTHSKVYVNDLPPFPPQVPYVAAVVDLDEGPRMMTRLVDCDDADIKIGMRLRMRAEPMTDEILDGGLRTRVARKDRTPWLRVNVCSIGCGCFPFGTGRSPLIGSSSVSREVCSLQKLRFVPRVTRWTSSARCSRRSG